MGLLEQEARFLTAKYGTAAGQTGLPRTAAPVADATTVMIILGLLIFLAVLYVGLRDWQAMQKIQKVRQLE